MAYNVPIAAPATSNARATLAAIAAAAFFLCAFFGTQRAGIAFSVKQTSENTTVELSTTFSQEIPDLTTPWLWLNETEKQRYLPPVCEKATLARLGSSIVGLTFTTDELTAQGKSAVCESSARDIDGTTVNNGEQDEREKMEGMIASGAVPDKAQFVPSLVDAAKAENFDVDLYLQESNPRERQHRLLCMVEASEAPIEAGATDPALGRLVANKDKWTPVLKQQQSDCGTAVNVNMGSGPPKALRMALKNFSDSEAVSMLQCRAKASDTRTLFEVRDFMCLHHNRITRDVFYTKLQGNGVEMMDAERYQSFSEVNAADLQNRDNLKTADNMYNLKRTMDKIAETQAEINNVTAG